jgi:hypothetical protein
VVLLVVVVSGVEEGVSKEDAKRYKATTRDEDGSLICSTMARFRMIMSPVRVGEDEDAVDGWGGRISRGSVKTKNSGPKSSSSW